MTRLLIQDDIINKMDVYVDYTIDNSEVLDPQVILFDYGLELTGKNGALLLDEAGDLLAISDGSLDFVGMVVG